MRVANPYRPGFNQVPVVLAGRDDVLDAIGEALARVERAPGELTVHFLYAIMRLTSSPRGRARRAALGSLPRLARCLRQRVVGGASSSFAARSTSSEKPLHPAAIRARVHRVLVRIKAASVVTASTKAQTTK